MSVGLFPEMTEEQRMLADSAIRAMEAEYPLSAVREAAEGARTDTGKLWRTLGGLGCLGLLASEDGGGGTLSGNGVADAAIIASERGARLAPGPYVASLIVAGTLSRAGTPAQQAGVLPALLSGDAMATWAMCDVTVRETADGTVLNGVVNGVQDAGDCDWILLSSSAELGDPSGAAALADWQLAVAAVLSAAESAGAMDANFALALAYAKTRIAFGRPIGSFQGLKHMLARTSLALEMGKALVAGAAEALGGGEPDGLVMASIARAFVSENAVELTHDCFQVFGGIGFTWEHEQHLYMRRLASEAYLFGSPSRHRRRIWEVAGA